MDDLKDRVIRIESVIPTLSTKEDFANLRADMAAMRGEIRTEMANLRGDMKTEIANLRAEMHQAFVSNTRWTVGTMFAVATLALAAAKFLGI